jgi:amphi-Trp domain-containing protein
VIQNGHEASPGAITSGEDGPTAQGSETHVKLMELKDKTTLSREEAAARLHAIADELASGNDVVIEREDMRFVAHVPDQVNLKVEFELGDDGTELEIELTW